jgi:hypothetical protein
MMNLAKRIVIPAKAGTQTGQIARWANACTPIQCLGLGPRRRGDDSATTRVARKLT